MSVAIWRIVRTPMRRITIARTTKVYGRRSASRTIHMLLHQALTLNRRYARQVSCRIQPGRDARASAERGTMSSAPQTVHEVLAQRVCNAGQRSVSRVVGRNQAPVG